MSAIPPPHHPTTGYVITLLAPRLKRRLSGQRLVEAAPTTVKDGVTKEEAQKMKEKLEAAGATVEIK